MKKVAIITESAANLPVELIEQYDIKVLPILLTYQGKALRDGIDISAEEVYRRVQTEDYSPTTATFNAQELLTVLNSLPSEVTDAVAILLSRELTHSVDVGWEVQKMDPPVNLHVIDSRSAAMAQGFVVLEAARAAERNASAEEVVSIAKDMIDRVYFLCVLETFKYLRRGGRVGAAPAFLAETLQIKPIIGFMPGNGKVLPIAKPRTWKRGLAQMVDLMSQYVQDRPIHVAVSHGDREVEAMHVVDEIRKRFEIKELYINHLTPVMGAHAGPLVAVSFYTD